MTIVTLHRAGPAMTVQDLGRPGYMAQGLSVGGAADTLALYEAAALLGKAGLGEAIEMAGLGGSFSTDAPMRFCLTGAPMRATVDGSDIAWNAAHCLHPGQRLEIGGAAKGVYGYLSFAGAMRSDKVLGARSAHLTAGIGRLLAVGDSFDLHPDPAPDSAARLLPVADRCAGGEIRLMPGPQTDLFDPETRTRFEATAFVRGAQGNRQGVRCDHGDAPFQAATAKGLVSDFISCGDVQLTGEGVPYVLLTECQTIGGYPRIGTVLAQDMAKLAQTPPGGPLRFRFVTLEEAAALRPRPAKLLADLRAATRPMLRDPRDIHDFLGYQLISGVTCGDDLERL
jgi:allophanate hydrolase